MSSVEKESPSLDEITSTKKTADSIPSDPSTLVKGKNQYFTTRRIYQSYNGGSDWCQKQDKEEFQN